MSQAAETTVDLCVVGGGISGLAAAWAAHSRGWTVRVVETSRTVGGKVRTEQRDGYLVESGPQSFLGSHDAVWRLVDELGLQDEVIRAQPPGHRYVYRTRRARQLPEGPGSLLTGDYLSLGGKLRMLAEPFVLGDARDGDSVMTFAQRRLGREAAQYLVTPFVSGIWAGDPDRLGARDAFPRLWQWEHDAGSVAIGALLGWSLRRRGAEGESGHRRRGVFGLRQGFGSLPRALAAALPQGSVHTRCQVTAVEPLRPGFTHRIQDMAVTAQVDGREGPPTGYRIRTTSTQDPHEFETFTAKRVVVAVPARAAAQLLRDIPAAADILGNVELNRVAVIHFGGPDPDGIAPRGFGVLMPPGEGLRTLGILLPSSLFPGRTPPGHWLHTAFLGGTRDPDAVDLTDETLLSLARRAQQHAFGHLHPGRTLDCTFSAVVRWRDAIPQYRVGHREAMAGALRKIEAAWPGVTLAGSYVQGISVQDAVASGFAAIDRLDPGQAAVAVAGGAA